jgi:hypothetical protein
MKYVQIHSRAVHASPVRSLLSVRHGPGYALQELCRRMGAFENRCSHALFVKRRTDRIGRGACHHDDSSHEWTITDRTRGAVK